mgnify:CR=1 FL=1
MKYDYKAVEAKWQKVWEDEKTFHAEIDHKKPKFYALVEFPYPSGAGLHVGHPRSYTALDVVSRKRRQNGYNVLYPMGWDAFGLPTENFAMKNHIHPAIVTKKNVDHFREQLKALGFSFDWDREINTTDPEYYKWTQWIFLQLYKKGLAYKKEMNVNWCTGCKCVLANEEVVNGVCERCGSEVVHRVKSQWMLKITAYADKLIDGLDGLDYIERVATQQKNWIGRSHGAEVNFGTTAGDTLTVYTTRCDTLFGATYMVVSPEHAILKEWLEKGIIKNADAVKAYQAEAARKSDFERSELNKEKTGVQLEGVRGINPVNDKEIPIFISDYVLATYGTGAIMAVPAHDTRDWEFARKFGLPIIEVVKGSTPSNLDEAAFTDVATGTLVNSGFLDGLSVTDAKKKMIEWLEANGKGRDKVNYKLRDWVFSRQRYWGEPIPMVKCEKCGWQPLPESSLPLTLPDITDFEPGPDGESPLARHTDWVKTTCPCCGGPATRETDTMPQWAGSSWYFLRYVDSHNDKELVSREKADEMLPVDMYIGGVEHAVLHLLYSRFYTKFLHDIGVVDFDEPFHKLFNQGMITGKNGIKMSKSKGNVVSPDDLVRDYGCDSLRMYELFVGPPELDAEWDDRGIDGVNRFLKRLWNLLMDSKENEVQATKEMIKQRHRMVADITMRLESFSLNTVISGFMEYNNKFIEIAKKEGGIDKETLETIAVLLSPFAPHFAEEIWEQLGHTETIFKAGWPTYDEAQMKDDEIEVPVQINGKTKAVISIAADISKEEAIAAGKEAIADKLTGNVIKEIYVPKKIINIVQK